MGRDAVGGEGGGESGSAAGARTAVPAEVVEQVQGSEAVAAGELGFPQVREVREESLVWEEIEGVFLHGRHGDGAFLFVSGLGEGYSELVVVGRDQLDDALGAAVHTFLRGVGAVRHRYGVHRCVGLCIDVAGNIC